MVDIRVQSLADALGAPVVTGAILIAQVFEGHSPATRVAGEDVTFPVLVRVNLTGAADEVFALYTLPPNLYWRIVVTVPPYNVTRNVVLPAGAGPFDFADLVDVDPTTALPDPGSALADAFIAELEAIRDATIAIAVDDFSVSQQVESGPLTGAALAAAVGDLSSIVGTPDVACWGDSLTAQGWPAILDAGLPSSVTVRNHGVGGESAQTIAARQNALPFLMLPVGESIPASGGVTVTILDGGWPLLQGDGNPDGGMVGTIAGIEGTLSLTQPSGPSYTHLADDVYTFTRTTAGGVVPVTRPAPFYTLYGDARRSDVTIIWAGRNGGSSDPDLAVDQIDSMVQRLAPATPRFLILTIPTGRYDYTVTGWATLNTALKRKYGRRCVDVLSYLVQYGLVDAGIHQTSSDTLDIAAGVVPSSLRSDGVHLTTAGRTVVANLVGRRLVELGFAASYAEQAFPAAPPAIENVVPDGQYESGVPASVTSGGGATIATTTGEHYAGASALKMTHGNNATSGVNFYAGTGSQLFAVTAGSTVRYRLQAKIPVGKTSRILIHYYTALTGGTYITNAQAAITGTGDWVELFLSAIVPAGAVGVALQYNRTSIPTAGEIDYIDAVEFGVPV